MTVTRMTLMNRSVYFRPLVEREKYFLSPVGRWGPVWLQRFAFWLSKNLGMVGHPITHIVHQADIDTGNIADDISRAIIYYLSRGDLQENLLVYCGPDAWPEFMRMAQYMVVVPHRERFGRGGRQTTIFDIPVIVEPLLKGVAVVRRA